MLSAKIGTTTSDLFINDPFAKDASGSPVSIIRRAETNFGDLCADAFREMMNADIGLINGGGIRAGISKGEITGNDILTVYPF